MNVKLLFELVRGAACLSRTRQLRSSRANEMGSVDQGAQENRLRWKLDAPGSRLAGLPVHSICDTLVACDRRLLLRYDRHFH